MVFYKSLLSQKVMYFWLKLGPYIFEEPAQEPTLFPEIHQQSPNTL